MGQHLNSVAEGYVFTYRQRTAGGKKTDRQEVTHLRQVHSCRRLQRNTWREETHTHTRTQRERQGEIERGGRENVRKCVRGEFIVRRTKRGKNKGTGDRDVCQDTDSIHAAISLWWSS